MAYCTLTSWLNYGNRVVGIMGWRIKITVESTTQTDFVYGLGNIGLVTHLEVWIGITVACLPTLAPFYAVYLAPMISKLSNTSAKHTSKRKLKEAQHTIGSSDSRGFMKRNFNRLDSETLLELEEGRVSGKNQAMVSSPATNKDNCEDWSSNPHGIGVRHDIQVSSRPQERQML